MMYDVYVICGPLKGHKIQVRGNGHRPQDVWFISRDILPISVQTIGQFLDDLEAGKDVFDMEEYVPQPHQVDVYPWTMAEDEERWTFWLGVSSIRYDPKDEKPNAGVLMQELLDAFVEVHS